MRVRNDHCEKAPPPKPARSVTAPKIEERRSDLCPTCGNAKADHLELRCMWCGSWVCFQCSYWSDPNDNDDQEEFWHIHRDDYEGESLAVRRREEEKSMKVKREYAEALSMKADDLECDFDPEYLHTQLVIADDGHEKDHIAMVILEQLKRETRYGDDHYLEKKGYEKALVEIAEQAVHGLGYKPDTI